MANTKNKHSSKIHSKTRFLPNSKTPIQKIILFIIVLVTFAVATALICVLVFNPERTTKSNISHLATKYYEDYFYPTISKDNLAKTMSKYTDTGFAKITLRQLLLYNEQQNINYKNDLLKYCDENNTYAQFFPIEPFGKTDYRIEYTYSCNF